MYLVLIGWLYVVLMFSVAQGSVVRGLVYFFFLGVVPLALVGWLRRVRRRERALREQDKA